MASHSVLIGRRDRSQQRASGSGRRRRRMPDQRPVHRQRAAASGQLHAGGARQPALREPPVLQRHSGGPARTACFTAASSSTRTRRRPTPSRPIATCCFPTRAQIDTKPQLEIYADDVKCTHGATIGQIEENALFYLRSRGIDEASARRLLLVAFASECLDRMKDGPARTHVES